LSSSTSLGLSLTDRVAVITGASRNIGAAIATTFAAAGADLVLVARNPDPLRQVARRIVEQTGRSIATVPADVTRQEDLDRIAEQTKAQFDGVDVIINNAMGGVTFDPISALEVEGVVWEEAVAANFLAPLGLIQRFVPAMRGRDGASIINVLSTTGFDVVEGRAPYGTTKAALWSLTRYLAGELAPEIRVNAVCPGTVSPDGELAHPQWNEVLPRIPLRRFGTADEVAQSVLFLASSAAAYTTGQVLFVDGGRVSVNG
jgi:NAD(P)-dependent dehydrogenase (short-subunit alcohol dehydrogenase family)